MNPSVGQQVAYQDGVIIKTLQQIREKENKLINEYNILSNFKRDNFQEDEFGKYNFKHDNFGEYNIEDFLSYLNQILEEKKKFLLYKKLCKEQQYNALFKLLEYLNLIELKNKELETEKILLQLDLIEKELIPYKQLFT